MDYLRTMVGWSKVLTKEVLGSRGMRDSPVLGRTKARAVSSIELEASGLGGDPDWRTGVLGVTKICCCRL